MLLLFRNGGKDDSFCGKEFKDKMKIRNKLSCNLTNITMKKLNFDSRHISHHTIMYISFFTYDFYYDKIVDRTVN